jgi:hypothetical protein
MENIFHRRATRRRGDGIIAAWRPMMVAVRRCRLLSSTQYDDEKNLCIIITLSPEWKEILLPK